MKQLILFFFSYRERRELFSFFNCFRKMANYTIIGLVLLYTLVLTALALKEDECEGKPIRFLSEKQEYSFLTHFYYAVCIKTVDNFANSLDENTKKDTKLIEAEFRKFCKTSKNKEHRFVSRIFYG